MFNIWYIQVNCSLVSKNEFMIFSIASLRGFELCIEDMKSSGTHALLRSISFNLRSNRRKGLVQVCVCYLIVKQTDTIYLNGNYNVNT